jgi:hypothetical protein
MSEQAKQEPKGPEVEVKAAPKRRTTSKHQAAKPKPKPKLDEQTAKQLKELAAEIQRLEGLRHDLKALMVKAHKAKAPTADIAAAANYSVARTRQILSQ